MTSRSGLSIPHLARAGTYRNASSLSGICNADAAHSSSSATAAADMYARAITARKNARGALPQALSCRNYRVKKKNWGIGRAQGPKKVFQLE